MCQIKTILGWFYVSLKHKIISNGKNQDTFTQNKIFATSGPLDAHHGSCTTYVVCGPLYFYFFISRICYKYMLKIIGKEKSIDTEHKSKRKELQH